ncbi:MAG: FtsX-like permease family protein [Armatimonadota bacterium]
MMKQKISIPASQWAVAAIFAVLSIAILYKFVTFAEPPERQPGSTFEHVYDDKALVNTLTPANFNQSFAALKAASMQPGSRQVGFGRISGSPGFVATGKLIEDTFRQAGITPVEQEFPVVVPHTEYCELVDQATGKPIPGVTFYPFEPAGLIPISLPAQGVTGKLIYVESTEALDLVGKDLEGSIVLSNGMNNTSWSSLASMGVKAVIVRENPAEQPGDLDKPVNWTKMATLYDVPYPRFLLRGSVTNFLNKPVTVRCKVVWKSVPVKNIVGVLKADKPTQEALVINCFYDSYSLVPELAPGAEQALSVAAMLELVKALQPYKATMKRDIIFVATAGHCQSLEGVDRLLEAIETFTKDLKNYRNLDVQLQDEQRKLDYAQKALEIAGTAGNSGPWNSNENSAYRQVWERNDPDFRKWFEKCFTTIAGEINLDRREELLQARLSWIRAGRPAFKAGFDYLHASQEERSDTNNRHPLLSKYLEIKQDDTEAGNMISTPFWQVAYNLNASKAFTRWDYLGKTRAFFTKLQDYHKQRINQLEQSLVLRNTVFKPYKATLTINLELYSGGQLPWKDLAVLMGRVRPGTVVEPQSTDLRNTIAGNVTKINGNPAFGVTSWGSKDADGSPPGDPNIHSQYFTELESEVWFRCARPSFTIINKSFLPAKVGTPEDTFEGCSTQVVTEQLPAIGKALLEIAHGKITFKEIKYLPGNDAMSDCRGKVVTMVGTSSTVPSHQLGKNTFVRLYAQNAYASGGVAPTMRGIRLFPIFQTDPYGEYRRSFTFDMAAYWSQPNFDAARFDDQGMMTFYKDASTVSQSIFKNELIPLTDLTIGNEKPVNMALFRCTPVSCFQRGNPKTLNSFPSFVFLSKLGMDAPSQIHMENTAAAPGVTAYLEPDCEFYVGLMDGSAENPDIQTYRAFMLNVDKPAPPALQPGKEPEPELYGRGYLATDWPNLTFPYFDAAASMLRTNEKRLRLEDKFNMADKQMLESHALAKTLYSQAIEQRENEGDTIGAVNSAGKSLAMAINNHPVIRTKISNAVFGILWYLGLLVPFVFFFEKLICGFTDIRKQLLAVGVIFVGVFFLLKLFHPAFQMVRSPLMILLGFLIFLLSSLVTVMVSGKFKQNLTELRRREGYVEGADINRGGVVGTAFMLGLNNMRRRKVRTGLTCVTLVLITFAMICFASVSTGIQKTEYAIGKSQSNGLLRRDPNFAALTENELNNLKQIYGLDYPIATQAWLTGTLDPRMLKNTEIIIDREYPVGTQMVKKRASVNAAIAMGWNEPQFSGIDRYLTTKRGWFPRPPQTKEEQQLAIKNKIVLPNYVILPDEIANKLAITKDDIDKGTHPTVTINNAEVYEVLGIIDSQRLAEHVGMDGQSILPYDLNSIKTLGQTAKTGAYTVPQNISRLKGNQVMITSVLPKGGQTEQAFTVSCSVLFPNEQYRLRPDMPYRDKVKVKEQSDVVNEYLERVGVDSFYAIDGKAYYGSRVRGKKLSGLIELLIPILIAAVTVFNTMRGSVYERKDEIYVYNAVGIAPNHVFFMFMAEASVYAVIGAMLGYLLSQIVGTVLMATHLSTGLNMDYSAIETIYASIAIVASVLLSTIIPARTASRLALPSDEVSWSVPKVEGDVMRFNLPFTFNAHDRVAIISYFQRWLDANGEGSSGQFYCSPPEPSLERETQDGIGKEVVPGIETTVWLKPFDLGVSQRLSIQLPTDPETREFIARITIERLSGTTAAWSRTIMPFLVALRKQFLNWRAVTDTERTELFEEAKALFMKEETRETANV